MYKPLIVFYLVVVLLVLTVSTAAAEEGNESGTCSAAAAAVNSATDLKYKIVAIFSTLIVGVFGVCLPIFVLDICPPILIEIAYICFYEPVMLLGVYVMVMSSQVYLLPDARESLSSSCIVGDFEMTGVNLARAAAILTMIESKSLGLAFMNRSHDHVQVGQNLVYQFVELGIVFHTLIIGIALGASPNLRTIKPLVIAITFHQLLQGIARGSLISKAKFELKKTLTAVIVFSLTAPLGIGIGIGVAEIYFKNYPTTLIVSGYLNAAAAGILSFLAGVSSSDVIPHCNMDMIKGLSFTFLILMKS